MKKNIFFVILIISYHSAYAWPPTYGAEFELTNKSIQNSDADFSSSHLATSPEKAAQVELINYLKKKCQATGCMIEENPGKYDIDYTLKFKDGFWIKYSYDPGCVEITFKPLTLVELHENAVRVNEYVFAAGKAVKMFSPKDNTSHFNLGINSMFDGSAEKFLKFFVDYANRPDLALGSLGSDINNAPPLSVLKNEQRSALKKIVKDFNDGNLKTVAEAAKRIQNEVYTASYNPDWGGQNHYQAVGLKYVNKTKLSEKDAPMELRSVWAQQSMEDFILVAKLVEARVQYLNKSNLKIVYNETKKQEFTNEQLKTRFQIYVTETGLNFEDYTSLLPAEVRESRVTAIAGKTTRVETKLLDLIDYFDLLSSSEFVRNQYVEVLSNPKIQSDPRCVAYQQYFEKMSLKGDLFTAELSWFARVLTFLGLSPRETKEQIEERNTKDLFKSLHQDIVKKKIEKGSDQSRIVLPEVPSNRPQIKCKNLF